MRSNSPLETIGVDSLMTVEVLEEIQKVFDVSIPMHEIQEMADLKSLCLLIGSKCNSHLKPISSLKASYVSASGSLTDDSSAPDKALDHSKSSNGGSLPLTHTDYPKERMIGILHHMHGQFDRPAEETGYMGFMENVYHRQFDLVVAYVIEAFEALGCPLAQLKEGDNIPEVSVLPKQGRLMSQLYKILEEASLIRHEGGQAVRTIKEIEDTPSLALYESLRIDFPQYALEHRLLAHMGPQLSDCLAGRKDAVHLMFGVQAYKDLLSEVYVNSAAFVTATKVLINFLSRLFALKSSQRPIRILEVGAGTGATTSNVIELLKRHHLPYRYTFTDISSSLVTEAKKRFAYNDQMSFAVLNIEDAPPEHLVCSQDIVIATNTIHATRDLGNSCSNAKGMLLGNGVFCLVEITRNLYWYDLVFGLLEGWWLFNDSREHAIAHEFVWNEALLEAGFEHVHWSTGDSMESNQIRLIVALSWNPGNRPTLPIDHHWSITMETLLMQHVGKIPLYADIYYPKEVAPTQVVRPIALMVHGGGHVMLSRKDVRPTQTQLLLDKGLLPVSVDHRLCPEIDIVHGAMTDICTALDWARYTLPKLTLKRADIRADGDKVVVIGWSTGGQLAMSLGWTAPARGLKPPNAILVFYCPTNYQAEWWKMPHFVWRTSTVDLEQDYDLWDAVRESPITGYNVAGSRTPGGWMSTSNPRARIPLHMNWTGQTLPILFGALSAERKAQRQRSNVVGVGASTASYQPYNNRTVSPQPTDQQVAAISPLAQIIAGTYHTPTYFIQGDVDDFIPWQDTKRTHDELLKREVSTGISIVAGGGHMFEMLVKPNDEERVWKAVLDGYNFLFGQLGME